MMSKLPHHDRTGLHLGDCVERDVVTGPGHLLQHLPDEVVARRVDVDVLLRRDLVPALEALNTGNGLRQDTVYADGRCFGGQRGYRGQ